MNLQSLKRDIRVRGTAARARVSLRFFKTGKGEYGEGDRFLGLTMGEQREIAKRYRDLDSSALEKLLGSLWHEERMIGLLILVFRYERAKTLAEKREVFDFYIAHRSAANNWDLVDVTTPNIVGDFLSGRNDRGMLFRFARSNNLWERRMAIIATLACIRNGDFGTTLEIATRFLDDTHDLIHKATGWMLRETGKKNTAVLVSFLEKYAPRMPRTMLRSAIEKFPPEERRRFLEMKRM